MRCVGVKLEVKLTVGDASAIVRTETVARDARALERAARVETILAAQRRFEGAFINVDAGAGVQSETDGTHTNRSFGSHVAAVGASSVVAFRLI